jgi:arginine deiminase
MRSDLFSDRKCVHFKINKEVHFALRAKLFKHNISMQELFDEFARTIASDSPKAQTFIDSVVSKKLKQALSGERKRRKEPVGDFDAETLYNVINGSENQ